MKLSLTITLNIERGGEVSQSALTGRSWSRIKRAVKSKAHSMCYYCGKYAEPGEVDHVIPLSKGGTDDIRNLVWACSTCNKTKSGRTAEEAALDYKPVEWHRPNDKEAFGRFLDGAYNGKGTVWRAWQEEMTLPVWEEYTSRLLATGVVARQYPTASLTILDDYDTARGKLAEWLPPEVG